MFDSFYELFKINKKDCELNIIQKRDISYLKSTFNIITALETNFSQLKKVVQTENIEEKRSQLSMIENNLLQIKNKIEAIKTDLDQIKNIESKVKESIALNDHDQLENKYYKLNEINSAIDDLLNVIIHQPSISELKDQINSTMANKINLIISDINSIISEDNQLAEVYSQISKL